MSVHAYVLYPYVQKRLREIPNMYIRPKSKSDRTAFLLKTITAQLIKLIKNVKTEEHLEKVKAMYGQTAAPPA